MVFSFNLNVIHIKIIFIQLSAFINIFSIFILFKVLECAFVLAFFLNIFI